MKTRTFNLYWLTDEVDEISGPDLGDQRETLANAMNNAGIGGGALAALDYWKEITPANNAIPAELESDVFAKILGPDNVNLKWIGEPSFQSAE